MSDYQIEHTRKEATKPSVGANGLMNTRERAKQRLDHAESVMAVIEANKGASLRDIISVLHQKKIFTPTGKRWLKSNLCQFLVRWEVTA